MFKDAILALRLNAIALVLLACIEEQAERVENGFLEARRYDLSGALDAIEALSETPHHDGVRVLERAQEAVGQWEAYREKSAQTAI